MHWPIGKQCESMVRGQGKGDVTCNCKEHAIIINVRVGRLGGSARQHVTATILSVSIMTGEINNKCVLNVLLYLYPQLYYCASQWAQTYHQNTNP